MHTKLAGTVLLALGLSAALILVRAQPASLDNASIPSDAQLERGRYLVKIAGCNDCHTAGYAARGGKVPESDWLMGDSLGWRGPWGTTYPANLRLYMSQLSEAQWVHVAKNIETRPPMPWFALHDMSEDDLKAIYRYVNSLGPAGHAAPAFIPPDREPSGPYVQFPASEK